MKYFKTKNLKCHTKKLEDIYLRLILNPKKEEEGKTFLNINCAVMGLGNSSCGPGVLKKYAIDPNKKHQLRIRILD